MRVRLKEIIKEALEEAVAEGSVPGSPGNSVLPVILEVPKREEFGDFSTNIAMILGKKEGIAPRDIATVLIPKIASCPLVEKCETAGPGFINIFLESSYWSTLLEAIVKKGDDYGSLEIGQGKKVQVEFVSANPTGPLHIGHGRGAAVGDTLANILDTAGFDVTREYYINDVGNQMATLGRSLYYRYLEQLGSGDKFPDDHYQGEYIKDIAREFLTINGEKFKDESIENCVGTFTEFAKDSIMEGITEDLSDFGIGFDVWFSEKTLHEKNLIEKTINRLRQGGHVCDEDGAVWFRTTAYGDDKDRVLRKSDGSLTYFAADVAYHSDKLERGFDTIIDIWGADHHGYKARVKALFSALGQDDDALKIIFIQLVSLLRDGEPVAMSTRAGEFITLREVMDEVGSDACRFNFLMRKSDAQLEFDLEVAKKNAPENPVYYVQYCHARIHSIINFAAEKGFHVPTEPTPAILKKLELKDEIGLIKLLGDFTEVIEKAAVSMEPHRVAFYLQDLAGLFHPYYNRNRVVTDDTELTQGRLLLCKTVATVVRRGLELLGVHAPIKM